MAHALTIPHSYRAAGLWDPMKHLISFLRLTVASKVIFGGFLFPCEYSEFNNISFLPFIGTSRAMKYRVLRNECGFSQEQLENLTYQLSFRYGTATKAPRAAAVIQYSTRLSNTILSNCDYLFQDRNGAPKRLDDRTIAQERNSYFSREGDPRIFPDGDPRIYPDFSAEIEPPFHTHLAC